MPTTRSSFAALAAVAVVATAGWPCAGRAQTTVFSTFGPADSFLTGPCTLDNAFSCQGWLVGTNQPSVHQDLAQGFLYSGPTLAKLSRLRLALLERSASTTGITISFLHGADVNTATSLESWSLAHTIGGSAPSIRSFDSLLEPLMVVGDMYWVVASGDPSASVDWRWNWSPTLPAGPAPDSYFRQAPDPTWLAFGNPGSRRDAWDVSVTEAAVVPEPASLGLVVTGLLGIGLMPRRRRRGPGVPSQGERGRTPT